MKAPVDRIISKAGAFNNEFTDQVADETMNAAMIANTGSGDAFSNMQPYITMNYIIYTGV